MNSLKVEHINPFIRATVETLQLMAKTEPKPGRVALASETGTRFDVSGVIGLSGGARGTVVLGFPRVTALKIVSAFVGEKVLSLDDTVTDAIGELANIVAGAAKKDLTRYRINISLPSVVLGENHALTGPRDIIPMLVPFGCDLGNFSLIVRFKSDT